MDRLTPPQERALRTLERTAFQTQGSVLGGWLTAQRLHEKERTLDILVDHGLAEMRQPLLPWEYRGRRNRPPCEYRLAPGKDR